LGLALAVVAAGMPAVAGASASAATPRSVVASPAAQVSAERFDGATLLKGLFFGVGPAATRYPKLVVARVTAGDAALLDRLIADAQAREAGFLDRFASGMYSGNHVDIQSAANDAGRLLTSVAESWAGAAEGTAPPGTDHRGLCFAINLVLAINIHVAVNAFVAIALVYFVTFEPVHPRGLTMEQWVDSVARTL
jgi:SdpC family antimicrobial peptide